jgi:DNA-directed RNA polymerase subunit RPC12/RpoP
MKVQCPNCGKSVVVKGLGRKPLNIPLKNILEALQAHRSVVAAAQELGCSPAYIFSVLKVNGLTPRDVVKALPKAGHDLPAE